MALTPPCASDFLVAEYLFVLDGTCSGDFSIKTGVPQESVLSLFSCISIIFCLLQQRQFTVSLIDSTLHVAYALLGGAVV